MRTTCWFPTSNAGSRNFRKGLKTVRSKDPFDHKCSDSDIDDCKKQEDYSRRLQETAVHIETLAELGLNFLAEKSWSGWKEVIWNRKCKETILEQILAWQSRIQRRNKAKEVISRWLALIEENRADSHEVLCRKSVTKSRSPCLSWLSAIQSVH
jgi:hypothetical protein